MNTTTTRKPMGTPREAHEDRAAQRDRDGMTATITMEKIMDPLTTRADNTAAAPPIVAWMHAWQEGRRAFNDDRWPEPKPADRRTRNPYDVHADFTLHYWWARGNQGNPCPVDNYRHIPSELFSEDLGRSTPPPEPFDET